MIYLTELFLPRNEIIVAIGKKICASPSSMVAPQSPCGCEKITNWPTPIQTSCFIGPYNLHYLLFSGIGTLLCHHPYYFCSQSSQPLFGIGAGQPKITAVARCLFRHENTFDFAGGKGVKLEGGLSCCLEHFLEYTFFEIGRGHF